MKENFTLDVCYKDIKKSITFNLNDDFLTFKSKIDSNIDIYRHPYFYEIIERRSSNETLEDLLKRGIKNKMYDIYCDNYMLSSYSYSMFIEDVKEGIFPVLILSNSLCGGGGCSFEFVDYDNGKTTKLQFSKNAPKWRRVEEGLNLFGKCINKYCEAFNKEVIDPKSNNIKFSIDQQKREIKCPICRKNFMPLTFGFWKCEYQIKGVRLKNGEYEDVNINGKETKGDDFEYYDPSDNGTSYWDSLTVFVCPRQKLKYRS
jgi:hypothetical protein